MEKFHLCLGASAEKNTTSIKVWQPNMLEPAHLEVESHFF
jgi:hypothetical protein